MYIFKTLYFFAEKIFVFIFFSRTEVATPTIAATPIDRSRSMAAPSASPDARTQSNPLISVSALNDSIVTEEENERLKQSFNQMVDEEKG